MVETVTAGCPGPIPNQSKPSPLDRLFVLICCVWFLPDAVLSIKTKPLQFNLITVDVFRCWHCVKDLNAPDQQTGKNPAFRQVVTLADDHLIKSI